MAKSNGSQAITEISLDLLQTEVNQHSVSLQEIQETLQAIQDTQITLAQELHETKTNTDMTLPRELASAIDPAQVFLTALQAAVTVMCQKQSSNKALLDHLASNSNNALDVAFGVLAAFANRCGK